MPGELEAMGEVEKMWGCWRSGLRICGEAAERPRRGEPTGVMRRA